MAADMEEVGERQDMEYISGNTDKLLEEYSALGQALSGLDKNEERSG